MESGCSHDYNFISSLEFRNPITEKRVVQYPNARQPRSWRIFLLGVVLPVELGGGRGALRHVGVPGRAALLRRRSYAIPYGATQPICTVPEIYTSANMTRQLLKGSSLNVELSGFPPAFDHHTRHVDVLVFVLMQSRLLRHARRTLALNRGENVSVSSVSGSMKTILTEYDRLYSVYRAFGERTMEILDSMLVARAIKATVGMRIKDRDRLQAKLIRPGKEAKTTSRSWLKSARI